MASNIIDNLQAALVNHPSGGSSEDLPFLPIWNAAQIFSAKVTYLTSRTAAGVRYLTMYGQALYPVDNQNLLLHLSGAHQRRSVLHLSRSACNESYLPDDGSTTVDDWMAFDQTWETYIVGVLQTLNGQSAENFTPSLALLDEMMASFSIEP